MKFHIGAKLDAHGVRALVDQHPRMQRFRQNMARRLDGGESHAHALGEHILRRVVGDVADAHIGAVLERMGRIEQIREKIDVAIDSVLDGHGLPKEFTGETLQNHFLELQREMDDLTRPRDELLGVGHPDRAAWAKNAAEYSNTVMSEFDTRLGSAREHGQFGEPLDVMKRKLNELPPPQRALLRQAADTAPKELWNAIAADTEGQQRVALQRLREKMPANSDFDSLTDGIQKVGKARTKGFLVDPLDLSAGLDHIADPRLRAAIASGDRWVVQPLAVISTKQLEGLWQAHVSNGGTAANFAGYVRTEMTLHIRSVFGEHTAAHGFQDIDLMLKGPDLNTRAPGTDLLGLSKNDWVRVLEDKSHLASSVSEATGIVENLAKNLDDDAKRITAREQQLQAKIPNYQPDPRVTSAVQRMQAASNDLRSHLNKLPEAERFSTESLAEMRTILDRHRISLHITSGFGNVAQISSDLAALGIVPSATTKSGVQINRPPR